MRTGSGRYVLLICSLAGGGGGESGAWESCWVAFADLCSINGLLRWC